MVNDLSWSQFQFAKRSANTVAHLLARHAKNVSHDVIWLEDSLCILTLFLSNES